MTQKIEFKSQDKSLRKQMVIDAAVKVFHQKGYRAATLDDVANELGLTKPALYHYVSSKENLLSLIYIQALENFFETIYEITGMDLSPPEKLRVFIHRHLQNIVIQNLAMFTVFFSEENQLPEKNFQKIRQEKLKFTKVVEGIIEEGIAQGHFRPLNPKLLANAIIGMCNWLYRWYKPGTSSITPDEIADQFIDLLENGYLKAELPDGRAADHGVMSDDRKRRVIEDLKQRTGGISSLIKELETLI